MKFFRVLIYLALLVLMSSSVALLAVSGDTISPETSLYDLSIKLDVPVKTLKEYFKLDSKANVNASISSLGIDGSMIENAYSQFQDRKWVFSWGVVLIAMVVILLSLAATGFFVYAFGVAVNYFDRDKKILTRVDNLNKSIKSRDTSYDAVIAAIIALHCHLKEAEESEKLTLAWKREPVSVWKASSKFYLPNRTITERKKWD